MQVKVGRSIGVVAKSVPLQCVLGSEVGPGHSNAIFSLYYANHFFARIIHSFTDAARRKLVVDFITIINEVGFERISGVLRLQSQKDIYFPPENTILSSVLKYVARLSLFLPLYRIPYDAAGSVRQYNKKR